MKGKELKGDKYIYLNMAYQMAKQSKNKDKYIIIGNDSGITGGQNFTRRFNIQEYNDEILLIETKTNKGFTDFSRTFAIRDDEVLSRLYIYEYINEDGENGSNNWIH